MKETPLKTTLSFPVQPHILKYLIYKYGECCVYASNLSLAPILRAAISEQTKSNIKSFATQCFYDVQLTEHYLNKFDVVYSRHKIYQFNADADTKFREELYTFMIMNHDVYGIKYKTSFRDFLAVMDITENDIKFETLLKDFQRKRDRKAGERLATISS
ncbi:hypothetical protein SAMN05192545_2886 [Maribacter dokdonensis]|uniref:Uncharacterized protein n=1 Tax=Maribacter dokdonensis TaxID=320912 RepID=A0ABY0UTC5_9FLAO|nr:hypothetical protein SAMN05192545_2886 [Maribacter dokdonensis]